ncbi:MAG: hypothetical protein ACK5ND_13080 [Bacteroides sp.]
MKKLLKQLLLRSWLIPVTYLVVIKYRINETYPNVYMFSLLGILIGMFLYDRYKVRKKKA